MKFFELSWSWCEDYQPYIFAKETGSERQFRKDVKSLMVKCAPEYFKSIETHFAQAHSWVRFVAGKLPELGYSIVKPVVFNVFGAYIISKKDKHIKKVVGEKAFNRAVRHNVEVRRRLDECIMKRANASISKAIKK